MSKTMDITDIYRTIGRILRENGALNAYIVKSKILNPDNKYSLSIEVIAEGLMNNDKAYNEICEEFTELECDLVTEDAEDFLNILREAKEDGIKL